MAKGFHPDELSLLAAIHATPQDNTPRLVYADWLQENDQSEYAEFIRWQCQNPTEMKIPRPSAKTLAKWRVESPSDIAEQMRQRLGLNFGQWGRPCPSDTDLALFHRGLPITIVKWVMSQSEAFDRLLKSANPRLRFQLPLDVSTLGFLSHPIFARADSVSLDTVTVTEGTRLVLAMAEAVLMVARAGPGGKSAALNEAKDHLRFLKLRFLWSAAA